MLPPCEYGSELPEDQLEPALRVLWREYRDRRLCSEDMFQLRDEVHNEPAVWA